MEDLLCLTGPLKVFPSLARNNLLFPTLHLCGICTSILHLCRPYLVFTTNFLCVSHVRFCPTDRGYMVTYIRVCDYYHAEVCLRTIIYIFDLRWYVKDLFDPFEESIKNFKYHYCFVRPPTTSTVRIFLNTLMSLLMRLCPDPKCKVFVACMVP